MNSFVEKGISILSNFHNCYVYYILSKKRPGMASGGLHPKRRKSVFPQLQKVNVEYKFNERSISDSISLEFNINNNKNVDVWRKL
jgi:hypothetical protein